MIAVVDSTTLHDLIIVGSGPAGLTAALYAARAKLNPIVIGGHEPGGQLMKTSIIENWPGTTSITGPELMMNMMTQAKAFGAQIMDTTVTSVDTSAQPYCVTLATGTTLRTKSIIIATGATPNRLSCPGEQDYWGKGVSTCATCDGAFYQNRPVIIVGGGNSAAENFLFLTRFTSNITVVQLEKELTATPILKERMLAHSNATFLYNSTVTAVSGNGAHVTGVDIINQKTGERATLATDALFLAIGNRPNSTLFAGKLTCTPYGHIAVHEQVKTSLPGIFAAGDVQDPYYRQAIVSAGFGCMAALQAERYLDTVTF